MIYAVRGEEFYCVTPVRIKRCHCTVEHVRQQIERSQDNSGDGHKIQTNCKAAGIATAVAYPHGREDAAISRS